MSSSPAILNLKRKALECKNAGDLDGAKDCLRLIKQMQALQTNSNTTPDQLKQLALLLKQHGDLQGAKEALQKSKQTAVVVMEDPVNQASDEATLEELTNNNVEYSNEEMADAETMADMRAAGMSIPTETEYRRRSQKCKEQAVTAKHAGDIPAAKRYLLQYKQLEAAIATLYSQQSQQQLDEEEDGQDYSLLEELYNDGTQQQQEDDGFFEELFGIESTAVELEDLDDLDPSMLRDMMESGMSVPDVDEVLENAKEKKSAAIQYKKAGNIVAAKAALEESKRLEHRAVQLRDMLQAAEKLTNGDSIDYSAMDPEAALEAMLQASEEKPKQPQAVAPTKQEPLKSSHEYKVQAVTCKKEGRMQEAVAALQLYKQALAIENNAKKDELRKECNAKLQEEVVVASQQSLKFTYYKQFVNEQMGSAQLQAWQQYGKQCTVVMSKLKSGGEPQSLQRTRGGMKEITDADLSFIGETVDPAEQRLEITILEVFDLQKNKNVRQLLNVPKNKEAVIPEGSSIRIQATVQLPPSEKAPDDNVELEYKPQSQVDESYVFESCQYVPTERGPSRFAKLIARRMNRKRILFQVFYLSPKKGLFSRSTEETLLGTAVIQLKDLLEANVIASEFPLLDKTRQHELGGVARIAIRTGAPFGESKDAVIKEEQAPVADTGMSSGATVCIQPFAAYEFTKST